MRLRLDLSYDGAAFHGWAIQPGLRSVQGELEQWIATILRCEEPCQLTVAGRTDAGVHARGQVCHVDVADDVDPHQLLHRLSRALPDDVVVHKISVAPPGFDARFSAIWRRYVYRIVDDRLACDPINRGWVTFVPRSLDVAAMNACKDHLLGLRDFAPLCKQREGATTIRTLLDVSAVRDEHGVIATTVRADAFCHSMVRSLMGALTQVGSGRRDVAWLVETMAAGIRGCDVPVLPARGLVLEEVGYPPDAELAQRADEARQFRSLEES